MNASRVPNHCIVAFEYSVTSFLTVNEHPNLDETSKNGLKLIQTGKEKHVDRIVLLFQEKKILCSKTIVIMYSTFTAALHQLTHSLQRKAAKIDVTETGKQIVDLQTNQKAVRGKITELKDQFDGTIATNAAAIKALELKVGTAELPGGAVGRGDVAGLISTDTTVATLRTDVNNNTSAIDALDQKVGTGDVSGGAVGRDELDSLITGNTTVSTLENTVAGHTAVIATLQSSLSLTGVPVAIITHRWYLTAQSGTKSGHDLSYQQQGYGARLYLPNSMFDSDASQWLQQRIIKDPTMTHTHQRYELNDRGGIVLVQKDKPFVIPRTGWYAITASLQVTQVSSNRQYDGLKFRLFLCDENQHKDRDSTGDHYFSENDFKDDVAATRWILWKDAAPVAIDGVHNTSAVAHVEILLIAGRVLRPWVIWEPSSVEQLTNGNEYVAPRLDLKCWSLTYVVALGDVDHLVRSGRPSYSLQNSIEGSRLYYSQATWQFGPLDDHGTNGWWCMDDARPVTGIFFKSDAAWQCCLRHMSTGEYLCTNGTSISVKKASTSSATMWTVTNQSGTLPTNLTDKFLSCYAGIYTNTNPVLPYTITTQYSGQTLALGFSGTTAQPFITAVSPAPSIFMRLNL